MMSQAYGGPYYYEDRIKRVISLLPTIKPEIIEKVLIRYFKSEFKRGGLPKPIKI